jgi:hypothetical protein
MLQEKDEILWARLKVSKAVTVDDTGCRHQGKNGYTTQIGNDWFAWFKSSEHKNRLNFLACLRCGESDWQLTEDALSYMIHQGLPQESVSRLGAHPCKHFADEALWLAHLSAQGIEGARQVRIASEGAQVGYLLQNERWKTLVIVSDDAGQFNVPFLIHGLCWVHAERLVHKLIPLNEGHRLAQSTVRGQIWDLYRDLKRYVLAPDEQKKLELGNRFDAVFMQKTDFFTLNQVLKRLHRNKGELLQVLEHPEIPLHTNGSERDIREQVIRKKNQWWNPE